MFDNILKRIRKPLSIEYINKQLRAKGIATNLKGENNLTFKLYDMNWDLYCEKDRLGLRNSFNIGNDTDKECLLKAGNKLNNDRWIVKAFIDEDIPEEDGQKGKETISLSFSRLKVSAHQRQILRICHLCNDRCN